jgi:hypothetical protein
MPFIGGAVRFGQRLADVPALAPGLKWCFLNTMPRRLTCLLFCPSSAAAKIPGVSEERKTPGVRFGVCLVLTGLVLCELAGLCGSTSSYAQQTRPDAVAATYVRDIGQVQTDLDGGKVAEARQRLDATNKSLRSFEFDYLQARAQRAPADGGQVPDLIRKVAKPDVEVRYGVLNEINRQLVFICRDGGLRIHDLTSPEAPPKSVVHPQGAAIWTGAFSLDGKTFLSGHQNGEVLVWDVSIWEIRRTIPLGSNWPVRELVVAPDGSAFVAESEKELELWSLTGDGPKKVAGVGERYNFGEGLAFSPQGDVLATGGMFDIVLHNAKTGQKLRSMQHASYTMGLEFSPDGKRIASAPRANVNKVLAVFDVTQDQPLFNTGPFANYIAGMAFSPDGKRIAATGCEKVLRLFDAATGDVALALQRPECGAKPAFSRDGCLLGWSEPDGYRFINVGDGPGKQVPKTGAE